MGAADQRGHQQHESRGELPIAIHCGGGVNPNHNRPGAGITGGWQCGTVGAIAIGTRGHSMCAGDVRITWSTTSSVSVSVHLDLCWYHIRDVCVCIYAVVGGFVRWVNVVCRELRCVFLCNCVTPVLNE